MATAKKTAPAPAKKTAAPAAKTAPAAKKTAPAPAPAPAEEVEAELGQGSSVRFLGYGDDVPDDQRFLVEGETYIVAGLTEPEGDDPGGDPIIEIDNPDFNPKKKESETNTKTLAVSVLAGEYEVVSGEEAEAEAEAEAEEAAAPAPAPAAKTTKAAKTAKTATAPAPAPAAAKKTAKTAAKEEAPAEEEAEDPDAMPDLEGEDEEVLALVNGERGLIEVAQELEAAAATNEYRLGGVLFHIKKTKAYLEIEGGEAYAEKNGFALFLKDFFNVEYRKAMYLIDIYQAFTLAGVEDPAGRVAQLGWTKASRIARPMMNEGANVDDLLSLAAESTVEDLSKSLTEMVTVGSTKVGGTKVKRTTLKFRLLEEQGAMVAQTLEAVREQQGQKDIGEALVYILADWTATNGGAVEAAAAPRQTAPAKKVAKKATAKA